MATNITPANPATLTILANSNAEFTVRNEATGVTARAEMALPNNTWTMKAIHPEDGSVLGTILRRLQRGEAMAAAIDAAATATIE
jgi:hypothetical protein